MNRITVFLMACGIATCAWAQPREMVPQQIDIEDGDTLLVTVADQTYRVQLIGIDAPEDTDNPKLRHDIQRSGLTAEVLLALGHSATAALGDLLPAYRPYRALIDTDAPDRYGRFPGDLVAPDGRRLSTGLVAAGYAVPLADASVELQAQLTAARAAGVGLWGRQRATTAAWSGQASP